MRAYHRPHPCNALAFDEFGGECAVFVLSREYVNACGEVGNVDAVSVVCASHNGTVDVRDCDVGGFAEVNNRSCRVGEYGHFDARSGGYATFDFFEMFVAEVIEESGETGG